MNVRQQLQQALAALPTGAPGQVLSIQAGDRRVTCQIEALDSLACTFTCLTVESPSLASASIDDLKAASEKLAARLNYLLEPIGPVEVDGLACQVQLRSKPPQKDEEGVSYYELLVRRGEISLRRFKAGNGQPRHVIAAHVTREVLLRLAEDLAST
ncbi:MAG: hypothetical protein HYS13_18950 [Planctomycetia bacterium]|nr:hypothetical protein [Planctomycetia bacterium]